MPVLEQVLEQNPQNVKVVFKNFPLNNHKFAMKAAAAALAAESQGKFWEFHDLLFKNYNRINDEQIRIIALGLGFDVKKFDVKMRDPEILARIQQDKRDGLRAGVRSTPTVFVNGKRLKNRSLKDFQTAVDRELEKLGNKKNEK
ncbi:MAG: thioredoxin domain-containing protein [Deltaproteobacteria bacterium]|nr:thioredoxin domain-containing protein [Deltaproteobacteria bacterium]